MQTQQVERETTQPQSSDQTQTAPDEGVFMDTCEQAVSLLMLAAYAGPTALRKQDGQESVRGCLEEQLPEVMIFICRSFLNVSKVLSVQLPVGELGIVLTKLEREV